MHFPGMYINREFDCKIVLYNPRGVNIKTLMDRKRWGFILKSETLLLAMNTFCLQSFQPLSCLTWLIIC